MLVNPEVETRQITEYPKFDTEAGRWVESWTYTVYADYKGERVRAFRAKDSDDGLIRYKTESEANKAALKKLDEVMLNSGVYFNLDRLDELNGLWADENSYRLEKQEDGWLVYVKTPW